MIALAGESTAPAVWFAYSPDRKGEHPGEHLKDFAGTLQADAYSGFHHLYDTGRIREGGVLGACPQEVPRHPRGASFADNHRRSGAHRPSLPHRR